MAFSPEDLVRRVGAAIRSAELYAPTHPLVQRTVSGLNAALAPALVDNPTVIVGFLENDIVVNDFRLPRGIGEHRGPAARHARSEDRKDHVRARRRDRRSFAPSSTSSPTACRAPASTTG